MKLSKYATETMAMGCMIAVAIVPATVVVAIACVVTRNEWALWFIAVVLAFTLSTLTIIGINAANDQFGWWETAAERERHRWD